MCKKITQEEFLNRAKNIHGNLYTYNQAEYLGRNIKLTITCSIHGNFEQAAFAHLKGQGCPKCGINNAIKKQSKGIEQFIKEAVEIHDNKYDYSKSIYINSKSKVEIICKIHCSFWQTPGSHINKKSGCVRCAGLEKITKSSFIEKSKKIHKNIYDYSKAVFINRKTQVTIICPIHGEFKQRPAEHLSGKSCQKCAGTYSPNNDEIVEQFEKAHGDFYDYSKVEYVNNTTKVLITCPKHGDFLQTPKSHKRGEGCMECGRERTNEAVKEGFYNIIRAERHKEKWLKTPCILYFVNLYNEEESFYKVGITKHKKIKNRFCRERDIYNLDVIKRYDTNLYTAAILESVIKEENKEYSYEPNNLVTGKTECFTHNILEQKLNYKLLF